jgi:arginyl-tRNA synthetase
LLHFRNLEEDGTVPQSMTAEQLCILDKPEEIELIRYIASLPNTIDAAAKEYDPAKITRYSLDLRLCSISFMISAG